MRGLAGAKRVIGFGSSMAALAVASFLVMPVMMRASGPVAWSAIALGQSIGGVGSVLVGYGWSMSGPSQIAGAGPAQRRRQFLDSLSARVWLFFPVAVVTAVLAWCFATPSFRWYAVAGAIFSTSVGLSSTWYFVGTVQPRLLLLTETMPRILGTLVGVVLMLSGSSAMAGILGQLGGMLLAPLCSGVTVVRELNRTGSEHLRSEGILTILRRQADGVLAAMSSSAVGALPIVLVQMVNVNAMPLFAFVDKVQRQMAVAMTPFITVLQGWVPRGNRTQRSLMTLTWGGVICAVLALLIALFSPLITWFLGGGVIHTSIGIDIAMGLFVGIGTYDMLLSHTVLATYAKLRYVSMITTTTGLVSLLALIPAVRQWGAPGALYVLLAGMLVRVVSESRIGHAAVRAPRRAAETGTLAQRPSEAN